MKRVIIIAERLKRLRLDRKMTQQELSKRSGVQQQTISQYETARNAIGVDNITKLAQALECKPEDIDERFADLTKRAHGVERVNNTRRIDDDILRYIVDSWTGISVIAKSQILNIAVEQIGNHAVKTKSKNANQTTAIQI
ncbi:MAG: helix-turn-helix domain-containing protein [Planctomycetota bacterium]|nr:helix-turn-helix domain-containing protein [Planctomycetota bacterium]